MTVKPPQDPTPPPTSPEGVPVRRRRGDVRRKDGRVLRRVYLYLPVPLARELRIYAARVGRDQSELVEEAVRRLLAEAAAAKPPAT